MTDITELAQREKFEAWWERTQHNGNPPRFCWSHWRDGEGYKIDDDESELDGMWSAWKAAGAELVEALEKAQQRIAELESRLNSADKLQDSAFRSGLQHGFSLGQTDDQKGYEQSMAAYSSHAGIKVEDE
ncbi:hypothetical protein AAHC61_03205 [Klebsiella quasipneumoniae subsp. quasipneumoniae]|uniref:hypothetical protein n=1 Tax=Klebsiella quasipneumoniae TaxID=1463165 RepID=UPI0020103DFC|nr:hypothetical protein [Klebsiella quasipneumoniae]MCL1441147.1 hypothetical protein [Klebsiella quasipneumoniae]